MDEEKVTGETTNEDIIEENETTANDVDNEENNSNDDTLENVFEDSKPTEKKRETGINLKARLAFIIIVICVAGSLLFNNQFTKGIIYNLQSRDKNATAIKLENGFGLNSGIFGDVIVSSSRNSLKLYDKKGKLIQTELTEEIYGSIPDVTDLVTKTADSYMLAYDENGKIFYKINNKGIEFNTKLDYSIILAKPFDNDMFAVITEDSGSNHQIRVYNADCKEVYIWHSGGASVLDVAINKKGDKMAVASLETYEGKISTKISLFNLNDTLPYNENIFTDNMITSVNYASENDIVAIGDKYLSHINSSGKITSNYSYNNRFLHTYKNLENGAVALAYQRDGENITIVEILNKKSAVKGTYKIDSEILSLDSKDGTLLIGTKDEFIVVGSKGMQLRKSKTTKEIKKALFFDENKFLLVGNSEIKITK